MYRCSISKKKLTKYTKTVTHWTLNSHSSFSRRDEKSLSEGIMHDPCEDWHLVVACEICQHHCTESLTVFFLQTQSTASVCPSVQRSTESKSQKEKRKPSWSSRLALLLRGCFMSFPRGRCSDNTPPPIPRVTKLSMFSDSLGLGEQGDVREGFPTGSWPLSKRMAPSLRASTGPRENYWLVKKLQEKLQTNKIQINQQIHFFVFSFRMLLRSDWLMPIKIFPHNQVTLECRKLLHIFLHLRRCF